MHHARPLGHHHGHAADRIAPLRSSSTLVPCHVVATPSVHDTVVPHGNIRICAWNDACSPVALRLHGRARKWSHRPW